MSDSPSTNQGSTSGQSVRSGIIEEESGVTPFTYILLTWGLLLVSTFTLIVIVCNRNRRRQRDQHQHNNNAMVEEGRQPADSNQHEELSNQKTNSSSHFQLIALVAINAIFALALSIYANSTCEFLQADDRSIIMSFPPLNANDDTFTTVEVYSLGLWSLVATNGAPGYLEGDLNGEVEACFEVSYLFYLDGYYKMARASAVIASLIGGLSLLTFLVLACDFARLRRFSRLLGWSFGVTTVFQLFTLAFLGTEYCDSSNCSLHKGGASSVTAAAYWLFCVFAVLSGVGGFEQ
ncbi:unnamed protein product [Cylindrotheca closterium]|uniref:Uncharacterized protein n=1 Tax=Cylindrotheca closterium TaxID=2856 RepID=A0AAD2CWV7_9STRA|nr:unnamed protein product [Cylindrotheca closterium]